MLPEKRPLGVQAVEQVVGNEEPFEVSQSVNVNLKKPCLISQTCAATGGAPTTTTTATNTANGSNIGENRRASESEPSIMGLGEGNSGNPMEIDEDLHSRQLEVYGRETMRKLFASNVLVSGLQGLGAEIAHSSLVEYVANWLGLNQSKYQWVLDDYYESKELSNVIGKRKGIL